MLLSLWYYFSGYVIIKITGYGVARFMNMLSYRGIYIWEVNRINDAVTMKINKKSLGFIDDCAIKTGCTMEILGQGGLPSQIKNAKSQQVFIYGIFIFAVSLYFLSSVVWSVEIEGNKRILTEEISQFCDEIGVKAGVLKKGLDTKNLTKEILGEFSDISWVSVGINGTKLEIKVAETIEQTEIIDKNSNKSIYASEKGIITSVIVERGTPKVVEGDVVLEGDILISSEILIGEADVIDSSQTIEQVNADGVVMAKVWREAEEIVYLEYEEKVYTGEVVYNWVLCYNDLEFDFVKPSLMEDELVDIEVVLEKEFGIGEFGFGMILKKEEFAIYNVEKQERTVDEAKKIIHNNIKNKLENNLSYVGIIEELNVDYEIYTDYIRGMGNGVIIEDISM